jgi:hypothetical protein
VASFDPVVAAKRSPFYGTLSQCCPDITDPYHVVFAFMLHEKSKGPKSRWSEYWQVLPSVVATPVSLDDGQLECARGTGLYEKVLAIRKQMRILSKKLQPLVVTRPDLLPSATAKELTWCYQIFFSRALSVLWPPNGEHTYGCLVPLADMLNHSPTSKVSYLSHFEQHVFSIRVQQDVTTGSQVFLNYGSKV